MSGTDIDPNGLTPAVFRRLNRQYRLKVEAQNLSGTETQNAMKRMIEAGVNAWAVKIKRQLDKMEPETGSQAVRALLTYLTWEVSPIMTQRDLFDGNRCLQDVVGEFLRIPSLSDGDRQALVDDRAEDAGYRAATEGVARDVLMGRYIAGSSEMARALEGFARGLEVVKNLTTGAVKVEAGKGRRGKQEAKDEPEADTEAEEKPKAEKPRKQTKADEQRALKEKVEKRQAEEADKNDGSTPNAPEIVAEHAADDEAPKVIDLLNAPNWTKAQIIKHYNHFAALIGEAVISSLESKAVGVERLKGLHARWHAWQRTQDEKAFTEASA